MTAPSRAADTTIIGGGVVGLSTALGMLRAGQKVRVVDGFDSDLRASQGNFGLVWLQGKGAGYAPYAKLSRDAVAAWPEFSQLLQDVSGLDLSLDQSGGHEFFTDEAELAEFAADLEQQQHHLGNRFSYEVITGDELRRQHPEIGPKVVGATFCTLDGHVNPLRLLRALRIAVQALGGEIVTGTKVIGAKPAPGGGFDLTVEYGASLGAGRIILCAGLGTSKLAEDLGFATRVRPQRGELLITEKLGHRLPFISSTIRQVDEGGLQIGGTKADAGFDDNATLDVMAGLARHAVDVLPALQSLRVIRAWGALRVLSPDGYPVYARAPGNPDAMLVTCHSGVTLAPVHGGVLADWIADASSTPHLEAFDEHRFSLRDPA